ncbi:MAG: hypothetical protein M3451_04840, partial [Chloroflexota bacterium]|nr:hypothetical protein [Chloroflexota bacterium]
MSVKPKYNGISEILNYHASRRQALKGAAALGVVGPFVRSSHVAAQDAPTVTWFAGRDTTGYTLQQVEAFNAENTELQINYQELGSTTTDLHDQFVTLAVAEDSTADIVSMDVPFVPEFAAA